MIRGLVKQMQCMQNDSTASVNKQKMADVILKDLQNRYICLLTFYKCLSVGLKNRWTNSNTGMLYCTLVDPRLRSVNIYSEAEQKSVEEFVLREVQKMYEEEDEKEDEGITFLFTVVVKG